MNEFNSAGGFSALQDIILDCKMKYSTLFNNNTGTQYFNSNTSTLPANGTLNHQYQNTMSNMISASGGSAYNNNEFKDKDTHLIREIRYECIKTLKSFVNTKVTHKNF